MIKFNSLLRFHDGASAALRAIRGYVFSRPGNLSDYDGWVQSYAQTDDWPDLPPPSDPWLHSAETQFIPRVTVTRW